MAAIELSKDFNASKEALYNAWTQPEQLKQWWRPLGNTLSDVENDIKPGGSIKYQFEGNGLVIDGKYEKVEDNLLEYTWNWHLPEETVHDAAYKLAVRFSGDGNHSTLTIRQDGFESEENIKPHQHGWEEALEALKTHVAGNGQPISNSNEAAEQKPPISGYMETPEQQKVGGG